MDLKSLFGAENFTKFSLEFLWIFYASGYFFPIFYRFFGIFSNWPDSIELMDSVNQICKHLFSSPKSCFKPFLFSSNPLPFLFQPPLHYLLHSSTTKHLPITYSIYLHLHCLSFSQNPPQSKSPKLLSQTLIVCTHIWSTTSSSNGT